MITQDQINKFKKLEAHQVNSDKISFDSLKVVYLDVPAKIHFPKLKDESGKVKKDEDGHDARSTTSDGWLFTFSELGTSQVVKAVLPKKYTLEMNDWYIVSGKGYRMRNSNIIYLDEACHIKNYQ